MQLNPLSGKVIALSWGAALAAWPVAWILLACAQGIGTLIAGGSWIGVAVPLGAHPAGLVNEPSIAFAASRAALFLYWLAPPLGALAVAALLPTVVPVPRSWLGELAVFHLAVASATLGLGWAAHLGGNNGPVDGLSRFWNVPPATFATVSALAGAAVVQLAVVRLGGHLWVRTGGPTRSRRLLATVCHAFPPALFWIAVAIAQGWAIPPTAVVTTATVAVGALVGAWVWAPHAPLRLRPDLGWGRVTAAWAVGCLLFTVFAWTGRPRGGQGAAFVWGTERETSNVPVGATVVRIMPHHGPKTPPAP